MRMQPTGDSCTAEPQQSPEVKIETRSCLTVHRAGGFAAVLSWIQKKGWSTQDYASAAGLGLSGVADAFLPITFRLVKPATTVDVIRPKHAKTGIKYSDDAKPQDIPLS